MTAAGGIRARNRAALEAEILRIGQQHLATYGAAGLSLRAVARDLEMASSAVYRYVASRDELLTRLIVAAYDALGDHVDAALATVPRRSSPARRFRTIAAATREWALANPHEYALIYGSPVPGYHAPAERTGPAGTRVQARLVALLPELSGGRREIARDRRALGHLPETIQAELHLSSGGDQLIDAGTLRRGMTAWALVTGTVSAEVFEQFGADTIPDWPAFFDAAVDDALALVTNP